MHILLSVDCSIVYDMNPFHIILPHWSDEKWTAKSPATGCPLYKRGDLTGEMESERAAWPACLLPFNI